MPAIKGVPSKRKGVPNKVTREAREAIKVFVDNNAERMQGWLDDVANGVPMRDVNGLVMLDSDKRVRWEREPNPQKAFELVQAVVEYVVPKLGRQEITGPDGGGIVVQILQLSDVKAAE